MSSSSGPAAPAAPASVVAAPATPAQPASNPGQQAAKPPETAPVAAKQDTKPPAPSKIKIGDQEFTENDLMEILAREAQVTSRLSEAQKLRAEAEAKLARVKTPAELRKFLKENPDFNETAFAEEILTDHLENELLTPAEKEQRARDKELEDFRARDKAQKEAEAQAQLERQATQYREYYEKSFLSALQEVGLPPTPENFKAMVKIVRDAAAEQVDFQPLAAARLVQKQLNASRSKQYSSMTAEELVENLPPEVQKAFISAYEKKLVEKVAPKNPEVRAPAPPPEPPKRMRAREWEAAMLAQYRKNK